MSKKSRSVDTQTLTKIKKDAEKVRKIHEKMEKMVQELKEIHEENNWLNYLNSANVELTEQETGEFYEASDIINRAEKVIIRKGQ